MAVKPIEIILSVSCSHSIIPSLKINAHKRFYNSRYKLNFIWRQAQVRVLGPTKPSAVSVEELIGNFILPPNARSIQEPLLCDTSSIFTFVLSRTNLL